jgi:hypothetical protein
VESGEHDVGIKNEPQHVDIIYDIMRRSTSVLYRISVGLIQPVAGKRKA